MLEVIEITLEMLHLNTENIKMDVCSSHTTKPGQAKAATNSVYPLKNPKFESGPL